MIYLADVDIVIKLAACEMLDDLPGLLQCADENLHVLATARYVIKNRKNLDSSVRNHAVTFCETHSPEPDIQDSSFLDRLVDAGIDIGEATLLAAANESGGLVVTGDKRCIRAVASHPRLVDVTESLQGRIVCLEELLLRFSEKEGYAELCRRCTMGRELDQVLRICFSSGLLTEEAHALAGIRDYYLNLRRDAGGLLVPRDL